MYPPFLEEFDLLAGLVDSANEMDVDPPAAPRYQYRAEDPLEEEEAEVPIAGPSSTSSFPSFLKFLLTLLLFLFLATRVSSRLQEKKEANGMSSKTAGKQRARNPSILPPANTATFDPVSPSAVLPSRSPIKKTSLVRNARQVERLTRNPGRDIQAPPEAPHEPITLEAFATMASQNEMVSRFISFFLSSSFLP